MSLYFEKKKGWWRYDFTLNKTRYMQAGFQTKKEAKQAEFQKRQEIEKANLLSKVKQTQTDMAFFELVNKRLDFVKSYQSDSHYGTYKYLAKRWVNKWEHLLCKELTQEMIEDHLYERREISAYTANKDLRYLRATFNFGIKKRWVQLDPTNGIDFFPVEKLVKFIPSEADIDKVIDVADPDTQDYLWTIRETMARVSEVNRLTWKDINFDDKSVILYTRKKSGGHLTPRKIPMTEKLYEVLSQRFENRDKSKEWVFWHRYWSAKAGKIVEGPFIERKKIMKTLCKKAGEKYFRFHPIRHCGASVLDKHGAPLGSIQRLLGHENRKTTEIYLHSIGEPERDVMKIFDRVRKTDR